MQEKVKAKEGWAASVDQIMTRRKLALAQGGEEGVARQHALGRSTIRERIAGVVDEGSFREHGKMAGDPEYDDDGNLTGFSPSNYVIGIGKIEGRQVVVGGEDFTLRGGSPNPSGLKKSVYAEDLAYEYKLPLIRFHEGGGGSVAGNTGEVSRRPRPAAGSVFSRQRFLVMTKLLDMVPVCTAAMGPVAGLPAARLCAAHFSVMNRKTAQVLVAGPRVVERALNENLSKEELGGAHIHLRNGVVHNGADDDEGCYAEIRRFLSYMPAHVWELPPMGPRHDPADRAEDALLDIVPRDRRKAYNMRKIIDLVLDRASFFEMSREYGRSQITGLARLCGRPVGVIANDCRFYAGAMGADGAQKVKRFIDLCDTFHLPIVSFVDEPGFMIGSEAEKDATIRYGTECLMSVVTSVVPWASIQVRKSFGVAGGAHYGPNGYVLIWPSAESGALPLEGGVAVAFGREIAAAEDPDKKRQELEDMLAARQSPFPRAEGFSVHELIDPRETRAHLSDWIEWVSTTLSLLVPPPPKAERG